MNQLKRRKNWGFQGGKILWDQTSLDHMIFSNKFDCQWHRKIKRFQMKNFLTSVLMQLSIRNGNPRSACGVWLESRSGFLLGWACTVPLPWAALLPRVCTQSSVLKSSSSLPPLGKWGDNLWPSPSCIPPHRTDPISYSLSILKPSSLPWAAGFLVFLDSSSKSLGGSWYWAPSAGKTQRIL